MSCGRVATPPSGGARHETAAGGVETVAEIAGTAVKVQTVMPVACTAIWSVQIAIVTLVRLAVGHAMHSALNSVTALANVLAAKWHPVMLKVKAE